jgi:AcrR family transcriptional regulator
MGRPRVHDTDAILDAARDLILNENVAAATMTAIAEQSSAPIGTLYHRFGSRGELLAGVWLRAQERFLSGFREALQHPDPLDAIVQAARWIVTFSKENAADARLMAIVRPRDVLSMSAEGLAKRNMANAEAATFVDRTARRLSKAEEARARVWSATFDMPSGAVRRPLAWHQPLADTLEDDVEAAARAILSDYANGNGDPNGRPTAAGV